MLSERNGMCRRYWKYCHGQRLQAVLPHGSGTEALDPRGSGRFPVRRELRHGENHLRVRFGRAGVELLTERMVQQQPLFAGSSRRYRKGARAAQRGGAAAWWPSIGPQDRNGQEGGSM